MFTLLNVIRLYVGSFSQPKKIWILRLTYWIFKFHAWNKKTLAYYSIYGVNFFHRVGISSDTRIFDPVSMFKCHARQIGRLGVNTKLVTTLCTKVNVNGFKTHTVSVTNHLNIKCRANQSLWLQEFAIKFKKIFTSNFSQFPIFVHNPAWPFMLRMHGNTQRSAVRKLE